jgi:hypothetical protein
VCGSSRDASFLFVDYALAGFWLKNFSAATSKWIDVDSAAAGRIEPKPERAASTLLPHNR